MNMAGEYVRATTLVASRIYRLRLGSTPVAHSRAAERRPLGGGDNMKQRLPPTYFFGAIVLAVAVHLVLPLQQLFHFPWRLIGLLPLLLGILLNLLADRVFKKHDTTVKPFEESTALVTGGVFSFTRNPMYLGMTLILFGIAAMLGSATAFLVVPLFAALLDRLFIIPEEEMLDDTFGQQFRQYRGRVRRWL